MCGEIEQNPSDEIEDLEMCVQHEWSRRRVAASGIWRSDRKGVSQGGWDIRLDAVKEAVAFDLIGRLCSMKISCCGTQILSKFFRLIARIPLEDRVMITGLDI